MMIEFLVILTLIWIIVAIIQDFRSREIANWLNFSLIIFALAFRLFFSIFSNNYDFFIYGLIGLGIFFILGHVFYYARLFAGGDAKLFIALGAIIPFANNLYDNILIFFIFLISLLAGGAIYSLIYSSVLSYINRKAFVKQLRNYFKQFKGLFYGVLVFSSIFIVISLFSKESFLLIFPVFALFLFFIYLYAKAVEQSSMLVKVNVKKLSVGDWLVEEIKVKDKTIRPYWEGLSESDANLLKRYYRKKVLLKKGVPFSPAFLIAFLVLLAIKYLWNSNWGLWQLFFRF